MNSYHPIWQTLHWAVVIAVVGGVLKLNASNFDHTEIKSLVEIGAALIGTMGLQSWLANRKKTGGDNVTHN